jgi:hypothetical protein
MGGDEREGRRGRLWSVRLVQIELERVEDETSRRLEFTANGAAGGGGGRGRGRGGAQGAATGPAGVRAAAGNAVEAATASVRPRLGYGRCGVCKVNLGNDDNVAAHLLREHATVAATFGLRRPYCPWKQVGLSYGNLGKRRKVLVKRFRRTPVLLHDALDALDSQATHARERVRAIRSAFG